MDPQTQQVLSRIDDAVVVVRKCLDATRNPCRLDEVPHKYDDKFGVVERATQAAIAVQLNTLAAGFGLSGHNLAALQADRNKQAVTLRFACSTSCTFKRRRKREEEAATRTEVKGIFGKTSYTSVTTYTDFFWDYKVDWRVDAVLGTDDANAVPLCARTGEHVFVTIEQGEPEEHRCPLDTRRTFDNLDVDLTWLLDACAGAGGALNFSIDRSNPLTCRTPRRNPEVEAMLSHGDSFATWCDRVSTTITQAYRDGYDHSLPDGVDTPNFTVINDNVFVPVAAMLALEEVEEKQADGGDGDSSGGGGAPASSSSSPAQRFSAADFGSILDQQQAELGAKFEQIREVSASPRWRHAMKCECFAWVSSRNERGQRE